MNVNGTRSDWSPVRSGIPQGSVLGPVMFVIFINDLPDVTHSMAQMFADDTKVYTEVNDTAAQVQLQNDIDKVRLEVTELEKDLGVNVDPELKFSRHIEGQVNKANKILGMIRRSYEYLDKDTLKRLFVALVRPHLEFSNVAWSPHNRIVKR